MEPKQRCQRLHIASLHCKEQSSIIMLFPIHSLQSRAEDLGISSVNARCGYIERTFGTVCHPAKQSMLDPL